MLLRLLLSTLGICLVCHGSYAQRAQPRYSLGFKDVPLTQWLTPYGSNCVKLNCEVEGERPWVITYEVNGVPLDTRRRADATALSDGSLVLCDVDPKRHSGSYRCAVTRSDRSSNAYKTLTLSESALRRYASTGVTISPRTSYVEITSLRLGTQRVGNKFCIKVTCTAQGQPQTVTTRFSYDRVPVPNPFLHPDITVRGNMLTNCASDPAGLYNCTAVNGLGKKSWRTSSISPRPTMPPVVQEARISSFAKARVQNKNCVRLICVASPSNVNIRVDLNRRAAGSSPRYTSLGRGILQVCYASSSDIGTATCRATYQGRSASRTQYVSRSDYGTVTVPTVPPTVPVRTEPPTVPEPTQNIALSVNAENCLVISCRPDVSATQRPYIYVSVNGRYGGTNTRYKSQRDSSLHICDLDYTADAGQYRCETYAPRLTYRRSVSARELEDIMRPPPPTEIPCEPDQDLVSQLRQEIAQLKQDLSNCNAGVKQCEGLVRGVQSLVGPSCLPYSAPRQ